MANITIVVNVGYRSTNYWVISAGRSRFLLDLGWPGSMGLVAANLRRLDIPLGEIRYALAAHCHIDHAGLGQELKQAGVPLLVMDRQLSAIPLMKQWTKPQDNYLEITMEDNVVISCAESRALLATIGIAGEILPTAVRWIMGVFGVVILLTGVLLFVFPTLMIDIWPWTLSLLTARIGGGWWCAVVGHCLRPSLAGGPHRPGKPGY